MDGTSSYVKLSRFRKPKSTCFQQAMLHIEIYREHVSKSGTGGGDQERRKRRK
jgi:hypothetical protein